MRNNHKLFLLISTSLGLSFGACSSIFTNAEILVPGRMGIFPHDVHMGEEVESDCVDCHSTAEDEEAASMPTMRACLTCHDDEMDEGKMIDKVPAGFVLEGMEKPSWTSVTEQTVDCSFSHQAHYEAEVSCEDCHVAVSEASAVERSFAVRMKACVDCHEKDAVDDGGCVGCHEGIDQDWTPLTHNNSWEFTHGAMSELDGNCPDTARNDCSLCHTTNECNSCHQSQEPRDHTEAWRVRGHGFSATMDRDRCITCHREDSCVRCHQESVPVTHGGIWGGDTSAHCVSCHLPLGEDDGCYTCHRNSNSHFTAQPNPGGAHPGQSSDCRSCHFPLDHFDNGQDCTICHR